MDIQSALQRFVSDYVSLYQTEQKPMVIQYDSNWPSPCYQSKAEDNEWVGWQPVLQQQPMSLSDFENALDITMDKQLAAYFSCYWSDNLNAKTARGNLQLLLPWNEQDFERLQQNLIAHVLMKRRLKQKETLFFAVTDEDDFIISVDNESGKVMLEQVGLEPQEELADSLLSFIQQLSPRL
ncbi:SecY-interacting protein [Aliiglaciecola litoralis]|uniref:Protein Syd n=1 Tax=Aliiglaciecola litoralis TaxID=582857 RepID=A0ABN1LKF7_9ALTE